MGGGAQGRLGPGLNQAHLEAPSLDLAITQALQCLLGLLAADGYQRLKVADADLADGIAWQAGVAGQGAQQVAGAQLVLLAVPDVRPTSPDVARR